MRIKYWEWNWDENKRVREKKYTQTHSQTANEDVHCKCATCSFFHLPAHLIMQLKNCEEKTQFLWN